MRPRALAVVVLATLAVACGDKGPSRPTPTPSPTPAPSTVAVRGTVVSDSGAGIAGARVEVVSGGSPAQVTTTSATGEYAFVAVPTGLAFLRASADGLAPRSVSLTITADAVVNFTLLPAAFFTTGRVYDGLTQAGLGAITIAGADLSGQSDSSGQFTISATFSASDPRDVTFSGAGVISRQTQVRVPGSDVNVSVIPAGFDLTGFDQMVRTPMLRPWTSAPGLLVERRALQFTNVNASTATALSEAMSDEELGGLLTDLTWALPQLTGGTFADFAPTQTQTSPGGATVLLLNTGVITVARLAGLTQGSGFWGYGRFQFAGDGRIVSGIIMLDRDFDRGASPFIRSLRAHELGHALGYNHVTGRTSVMNSAATVTPTPFDLDAFRLAFQRQPGNRTPDIDVSGASLNVQSQSLTWSPAIR